MASGTGMRRRPSHARGGQVPSAGFAAQHLAAIILFLLLLADRWGPEILPRSPASEQTEQRIGRFRSKFAH